MKYNILIGNEGEEHLIDIGVKVAGGREEIVGGQDVVAT